MWKNQYFHDGGPIETNYQTNSNAETRGPIIEAVIAYAAFCGFSVLSRFVLPVFLLVVASGVALPLLWSKLSHDWASTGFTRRNLGKALFLGLGTGLAIVLYIYISAGERTLPPMLGLQLAVGIPMSFLIVSPFQELFFRGWLQPRFQNFMGKWIGLIVTSFCFSLWHLFPPFENSPTSTLLITSSIWSLFNFILTTFGFGMIWGYIFQRTNNIAAPWLSHSLAVIALVLTGTMRLVYYTP